MTKPNPNGKPEWIYDDGGRKVAGFKGSADDCVCRSIAIAAQTPYAEVYAALNGLAITEKLKHGRQRSSSRTGVARKVYERYLFARGWKWRAHMGIGTGCQVHVDEQELTPPHCGRVILRLSHHLTVWDGCAIRDTHDPSRSGARCVYGYYYYYKPEAL